MGRKPTTARTSASSASAAAVTGTAPTFTSFAAATAHALGSYPQSSAASALPASSALQAPSQWDSNALQLLKKLSKRDATTKLRALQELTGHVESLGDLKPGEGSVFVSAWGEAFRASVLNDSNPGVRGAILALMRLVVAKFRRLVQPIFPYILPAWVAAQGDLIASVSKAASSSLEEALPTVAQRNKVVDRYGDDLRSYCNEILSTLNSGENRDAFLSQALRVIAILSWLVNTAGSTSAVSPVIDSPSKPLLLLAHGPKQKKKSASSVSEGPRRQVCQLAVGVLTHMSVDDVSDIARAVQFVDLALQGIRKKEPAAWDLVIVLLRNGWHSAFTDSFEKLAEIVGDAVTAVLPSGLSALLPLFDSLPARNSGSVLLASKVLSRLKMSVHPQERLQGNENSEGNAMSASSSYILSTMPSYIEAYSFAYSSGTTRWFKEGDTDGQNQHASQIAENHVLPTLRFFLSGQLPPASELQQQRVIETPTSQRRTGINGTAGAAREIANAIAHSLEMITADQLRPSLPIVAESLIKALHVGNSFEAASRYEFVLGALRKLPLLHDVAESVINEIMTSVVKERLEFRLQVLSVTLSKAVSICILHPNGLEPAFDGNRLVGDVLGYLKPLLVEKKGRFAAEDDKLLTNRVGDLFGWLYWAGLRLCSDELTCQVWKALTECLDSWERWLILGEMINTHKQRRDTEIFSPWAPLCSRELDEQVLDSIAAIEAGGYVPYAIRLITAAADPNGGAAMSLEVLRKVAEVVLGALKRSGSENDVFDEVITILLRSPIQHLESEESFREILAFSILRAAESEGVMTALILLLEQWPVQRITQEVIRMLDVWHEYEITLQVDSTEASRNRLEAISRIVTAVGQISIDAACTLCEYILSWRDPDVTNDLLRKVPMRFIFGDGKETAVRYRLFLDTCSNVTSYKEVGSLAVLLNNFLTNLDASELREISRLSAKRMLMSDECSLRNILEISCREMMSSISDAEGAFDLICKDILLAFPTSSGQDLSEFARIPRILSVLIMQGHDICLGCFRDIIEEAVKLLRRDPFSQLAFISIDMLSATLLSADQVSLADGAQKAVPKWLSDYIIRGLLAIRRSLERALGASIEQIQALETRSALLISRAIKAMDETELGEDNLRFWVLRARDILESFMENNDSESSRRQGILGWERLASTCRLSAVFIESKGNANSIKGDMLEEICHMGSWTAVDLLMVLESRDFQDHLRNDSLVESYREASSTMVVKAAENDVLVKSNGRIPVDVNRVYSMVPLLSSRSSHARKAALTLLVYTTVIDLPKKAAHAFPKEGFADEAEEIRLVIEVMPEPLRKALHWRADGDFDQVNEAESAQELAYFLSWRLFLDNIRVDESSASSAVIDDTEEDVSFRRVGITFLRANPDIYAEFFNRCTEVVVDGNMTERAAAGTAAAKALDAEERAAQGLQLAQQQESPDDDTNAWEEGEASKPDAVDLDGMDAEVGHAAGIAFARALQRLPALSRQHVTDRLDRSTALRVEAFVRKRISPLLIAAEIRKVREWGAFGGGRSAEGGASSSTGVDLDGEGELHARGSVAGREVWATYTFSDVTLEIGMRLPDVFPLQTVEVEARSRIGMSEAQWRKTLLGITTLLRAKDGTLAEAVELWRRNLDKTFQGAEECPICYSVLHLTTAALPRMQCRTCKNLFHAACMYKWFTKSNSIACPLCRSAF